MVIVSLWDAEAGRWIVNFAGEQGDCCFGIEKTCFPKAQIPK